MIYVFKSGEYAGNSIEQVALSDYLHLKNMLSYRKGSKDSLTKNIEDIIFKLNNFVSKAKCHCDKPAEYFPLEVKCENKYNPYLQKEVFVPENVNINFGDARCPEHSKTSNLINSNALLYNIKFDVLENFSEEPKWVKDKINDALLYLSGFNGKSKTKKNCEEFIKNLELKEQKPIQIEFFNVFDE